MKQDINCLIETLRLKASEAVFYPIAADRLEELSKQLEAIKKDREAFARELLEFKGCYQPCRPEWVKKDPSRLEIAAMIYAAGIASNQFDLDGEANLCGDALNHADALIAAAKEAK